MRLVHHFALVLGLVICTYAALALGLAATKDSSEYLAAGIDKHHILDNLLPPRVILVGGSNVAYGVNSTMMQQQIGLPVVNMGLHASLGVRYMLNEISPSLGRGDIILLILEYELYYPGGVNGNDTLVDMLLLYPKGIRFLTSIDQVGSVAEGFPSSIRWQIDRRIANFLAPDDRSLVSRRSFDGHGDVVGLDPQAAPAFPVSNPALEDYSLGFDDESITVLNQFNQYAKTRGATVFLLFPPVPEANYKADQARIQFVYGRLLRGLNFPVLSSPKDYVFPLDYFFDTAYHLNAQGRDARTEKLIQDLRTGLARPSQPIQPP